MANVSGGSVVWNLDVDNSKFNSGIDDSSKKADAFGGHLKKIDFKSLGADSGAAFGGIADGLGKLLKGVALFAAGSSVGFGAAAKASWDQVAAVQQATVALGAYEKSGDAVNNVLKDLVSYARSDLGVLFQRQDLFQSAQALKIMGDNTSQLVDHVKILSRSVGLGLSNWTDLNLIVGRVGSTGRLTGEDFDNLTKAGYRLDPALRNTNITFDALFKNLDKGIPTGALEGQANTIQGQSVRLQSAFRDVGGAILGVNKDTSTFVKGGLGDTLVKTFDQLRNSLKDPQFLSSVRKIGQAIGDFAKQAIPFLISGVKFLADNLDTIIPALGAVAAAFVVASAAATILGIIFSPISLAAIAIAAGVTILVAALTFLQLKFDIVGKAADLLKKSFDIVVGAITGAVTAIWSSISYGFGLIWSIVTTIFTAIWTFIVGIWGKIFTVITGIVSSIIGFFAGAGTWLIGKGTAIVQGLVDGIRGMAGAVWNAIKGVADQIGRFFSGAWNWLYDVGKNIIQGMIDGIGSMVNGVKKVAGDIGNAVQNKVKSLLGIHSPSKVFHDIGRNVTQGFVDGIDSGMSKVNSAASGLSVGIQAPSMDQSSADSSGQVAQAPVNITLNMDGVMARSRSDLRSIAKDMVRSINEELRAKGVAQIGAGAI